MHHRLWAGAVVLVVVGGCYRRERDEAQAEVARLTKELAECSANLEAARETPEARFERAMKLAGSNWYSVTSLVEAKNELAKLASVHGGDGVGPRADELLTKVAARIAELDATAAREEAVTGEPVEYLDFYSRAKSGIREGKRFRVRACVNTDPALSLNGDRSEWGNCRDQYLSVEPAFDDTEQHRWLMTQPSGWYTVTVSVVHGRVRLHRVAR